MATIFLVSSPPFFTLALIFSLKALNPKRFLVKLRLTLERAVFSPFEQVNYRLFQRPLKRY
jgi:hypothetical protein